jgi:tRNA threonylcarbamoyladenosine biosynthesis protein TsaB
VHPTRPVLVLETSVPTARVAVLTPDGSVLAEGERQAERASSVLLPLVDETLRAARLAVRDLGAIVCGAGPGSFTGLRVGLAVAKGLALPGTLPLVLVSSLETLAVDLGGAADTLVVPCLDAGKGEVYAQLFRAGRALDAPSTLAPSALAERVRAAAAGGSVAVGGTGADKFHAALTDALGAQVVRRAVAGPSARAAGRLGIARLRRGERDGLEDAVPVYGRAPDITRPRPRRG